MKRITDEEIERANPNKGYRWVEGAKWYREQVEKEAMMYASEKDHLAEELECIATHLDNLGAPIGDESGKLSFIGRINGLLRLAQKDLTYKQEGKEKEKPVYRLGKTIYDSSIFDNLYKTWWVEGADDRGTFVSWYHKGNLISLNCKIPYSEFCALYSNRRIGDLCSREWIDLSDLTHEEKVQSAKDEYDQAIIDSMKQPELQASETELDKMLDAARGKNEKEIPWKPITEHAYDGSTISRHHEDPADWLGVDMDKLWKESKPCLKAIRSNTFYLELLIKSGVQFGSVAELMKGVAALRKWCEG